MSTISTAYDTLVTDLETLFPSHKRMSNPYAVDQNASRILEQAWGLAVGSAINTNLELQCSYSVQRTLRITLARKYFAIENDPAQKATTEKLLLEDHNTLVNYFTADATLAANVMRVDYVSDGGIEFVFADKDQYLYISTDFSMDYKEPIT